MHPPALPYLLLVAGSSLPGPTAWAQATSPLTGTVVDARTQAAVPFATLGVPGRAGGTVSNAEGVFQLALPPGADSVRVQALGYAPLTLAVGALAPGATLRLRPQAYALAEVTVRGYTPAALLWQAVRRTTASLVSPVELQAYYREFTTYNGQVAKFADALADYYVQVSPRRARRPLVQVRVRESRAGEAPLSEDDASRAIPNPISGERVGSYLDVRYENPFLDSTNAQYYRYTLLESPPGAAEAPYYEVRCTPTTQEPAHLRQATVRIDRATRTIRYLEADVPARLQPYLPSFNLLVLKVQAVQYRQRLDYQALQGRLYPSFLRLQVLLDATIRGQLLHYEFASDLLVRSLAPSPAPIPKGEQYERSLYKRGTQYTHPYWREGNVVPATPAEEAAIQALAPPR